MSEVEPYRTINNEVDVAKKCYQVWQKVAKVAKKCYQMWQKVAKGVLSGSKRFQGLPRASKDHGLPRAPTVFQREVSRGIPRESATGCGKKSPKGFHRTRARAPACGAGPKGQRRRRAVGAGLKGPRQRRLAQGPKGPELVMHNYI